MPAVKRMWVFKLGAELKGLRNHLGSKEEELGTAAGKEPTKKSLQSGSKTSCFVSKFKLHIANKMVLKSGQS